MVAGVDEAGRGPLAGAVMAAAVVLSPERPIAGLADSKRLSPSRRAELARLIKARAAAWALASASVDEIQRLNILHASLLAMRRAVKGLRPSPRLVLVDGRHLPELPMAAKAIVRGDASEPAISAASILAKEARDAYMLELDDRYPGYDFARHKGYPTRAHLQALRRLGPCQAHRREFAPVAEILRRGK